MCTSSAELETHSNGRVLDIGQVMVWTSHVDSEYGDLSSTFSYVLPGYMVIVIPWVIIIVIFIAIISMQLLDHDIFIYCFTLT
jgi:hypothetical protein